MADLPPGRELDALVAEKVMGWVRDAAGDWWSGVRNAEVAVILRAPAHWSPSTDWRAAGEVMEKLAEDPARDIYVGPYDDDDWCAWGPDHDPSTPRIFKEAKTGPHAICLAAAATCP